VKLRQNADLRDDVVDFIFGIFNVDDLDRNRLTSALVNALVNLAKAAAAYNTLTSHGSLTLSLAPASIVRTYAILLSVERLRIDQTEIRAAHHLWTHVAQMWLCASVGGGS
jgi:hypothetical protein